jgi:hypothetical protein
MSLQEVNVVSRHPCKTDPIEQQHCGLIPLANEINTAEMRCQLQKHRSTVSSGTAQRITKVLLTGGAVTK